MTTFAEHVDDYVRLRRALGFKLEEHARLLPKFAAHLDAIGAAYITVDLALEWAAERVVRLGASCRRCGCWSSAGSRCLAGIDPRTEVPPTGLIRLRRHRRPPFIYTDEQVLASMQRARTAIRPGQRHPPDEVNVCTNCSATASSSSTLWPSTSKRTVSTSLPARSLHSRSGLWVPELLCASRLALIR
jgi:hypothetical protein